MRVFVVASGDKGILVVHYASRRLVRLSLHGIAEKLGALAY
jgi:hypothetical protein